MLPKKWLTAIWRNGLANSGLDLLNQEVEGVTEDTPGDYLGIEGVEPEISDQPTIESDLKQPIPRPTESLFTENQVRAFTSRLAGLNSAQIADEMGYSESAVREFLRQADWIIVNERARRWREERQKQPSVSL